MRKNLRNAIELAFCWPSTAGPTTYLPLCDNLSTTAMTIMDSTPEWFGSLNEMLFFIRVVSSS